MLNHENHCVGLISRNFLVTIVKKKFFEGAGTTLDNAKHIRADPNVAGSFEQRQLRQTMISRQRMQSVKLTPFHFWDFNETFKSETLDINEYKETVEEHRNSIVNLTRFMLEDPRMVTSTTSMWNCIRIFHLNSIRHLPVNDARSGELVGIMTRENIVAFETKEGIARPS